MKPTLRALLPALFLAAACAPSGADEPLPEEEQLAAAPERPAATVDVSPTTTGAEPTAGAKPLVRVWKSPTCGCCAAWVERVQEAGYPVEVVDVANITQVKMDRGVPARLASCHTAMVDGYLLEGHVPIPDMERMLAERPKIRGIAVPGMPTGAPGMEVPGVPADPFEVLAFDASGATTVYERH